MNWIMVFFRIDLRMMSSVISRDMQRIMVIWNAGSRGVMFMNLQNYLEQDRERFLASLTQAGTPEKVIPLIESEYDRLLYQYNEQCSDDYERRCAAMMLQTARMSASLSDCLGEIKIWEQGGKLISGETKKVRPMAVILLLVGILLPAAAVVAISGTDLVLEKVFALPLAAVGFFAGLACLFLAGLFFRRKTNASYSEKQMKAEPHIDAEKVFRSMRAVLLVADRNITDALSARRLEMEQQGQDSGENKTDLSFYSDLLEASLAKDGEYALDQVSKVPFYLHQKGIEVMEFSEENRAWFDVIPGEQRMTIRPALVKDGKLLKKGIVSGDW